MSKAKTKMITSIGGQATIEGVLMRGPYKTYLATRSCSGEILGEEIKIKSINSKNKLKKLPIIRGLYSFIISLYIGYKAMNISAEKALLEDSEPQSKFELWLQEKFGDKILSVVMATSGVIGVLLAILLFFALPTYIFNLLQNVIPILSSGFMYRSVFEGILRLFILLIYLLLCSRMKDMKRVFGYHGAEHKTIFCYENEEELTVENVKKQSRFHPRCGTSFLIVMLIIGIIVGFFIPFSNVLLRTLLKLVCIPLIVGIGYEIIKLCSRYDNIMTRIVSAPGMWMQRITTNEPDEEMIEVAIESIKHVIPENGEDKIKV